MLVRVKVLVEAKHLVLSRSVRLANKEELDPILEAQRAAIICRNIIEQELVMPKECEALYRGCSLSSAGIFEPKAADAKAFKANILSRLQHPGPLDNITLGVAEATLMSVMRLFVEDGALKQIALTQRIIDHKVPMSPRTLNKLTRLMGRIDRENWLWTHARFGQSALVAASTSIRKAIRATHKTAPQLSQQEDRV